MQTTTTDETDAGRTAQQTAQTPSAWGGAVTIHHVDREAFESDREFVVTKDDIRIGRQILTVEDMADMYRPVETIVGTTDLSEAYHHAQAGVVNREQNARHGVPSAHPSNVFEVVHSDGTREYHLVESIGFSKIESVDAENGGEE